MNGLITDLFGLDDKVAVVLGGTGVLCGTIAQGLAEAGARVLVVGRNEAKGAERVSAIESAGGVAEFARGDVMSREDLDAVRNRVLDSWGQIDILVNGAGGNHPAATISDKLKFEDIDRAAWDQVFDLNLVGGTLLPSQVFGKPMLERGSGSIVNIASMSGGIPLSRVVAYSAAKAAVINLTRFLAREWAPHGIRVNAISPGFFPSEQNRSLLYNEDNSYSERGGQIIGHTMMGRFGRAEELLGVALWLCSEQASSFVTGSEISVDGGFSAMTI